MKTKEFLKDKVYLIIIFFVTSLILFFMLKTIGVQIEVIVIALFALSVLLFSALITEYRRRYKYYKELDYLVSNLDDPYLIYEMFPKTNFMDARIFEEIVRTSNYAMVDNVNLYKLAQEDYKNYIELWVHEIKTPLAASKLIVENQNESLNDLSLELDKVEQYVMQALFYARSNSVAKDYIIKPINLEKSIRKVIKELSSEFIRKDIKIELSLIDNIVYTDSKWFEFMLKQIIINSLQYTKQSGKVILKMTQKDQAIKLDVIDNGIGILPQDIGRIFEQGFTGASGRSYTQATGMGLFLVKQLADALLIKVTAKSNDKTTISLIFPQTDMHFNT